VSTLGQFITLLLLIGFVGAYFWPIALTIADGGRLSHHGAASARRRRRRGRRYPALNAHLLTCADTLV
jgi:hypothetical protein